MLAATSLPKEVIGRITLYLSLNRIKGGHKGRIWIELEGKLMIRSSCAPVGESWRGDYCILCGNKKYNIEEPVK